MKLQIIYDPALCEARVGAEYRDALGQPRFMKIKRYASIAAAQRELPRWQSLMENQEFRELLYEGTLKQFPFGFTAWD